MISDKGLDLIARFEGCRLTAYPDPGTGNQPYTLGFGHTGGVTPSDTCTKEQALEWLRDDCSEAEACVDAHVLVEITQNQLDALISLIYNIGCGNFRNSTLCRLLNAGNISGAANQFGRWDKANGRVMAGLATRRDAEAKLFLEVS